MFNLCFSWLVTQEPQVLTDYTWKLLLTTAEKCNILFELKWTCQYGNIQKLRAQHWSCVQTAGKVDLFSNLAVNALNYKFPDQILHMQCDSMSTSVVIVTMQVCTYWLGSLSDHVCGCCCVPMKVFAIVLPPILCCIKNTRMLLFLQLCTFWAPQTEKSKWNMKLNILYQYEVWIQCAFLEDNEFLRTIFTTVKENQYSVSLLIYEFWHNGSFSAFSHLVHVG